MERGYQVRRLEVLGSQWPKEGLSSSWIRGDWESRTRGGGHQVRGSEVQGDQLLGRRLSNWWIRAALGSMAREAAIKFADHRCFEVNGYREAYQVRV